MNKLRLIVKVPRTSQVAHDAWTDATYLKTFEVDVPPEVYEFLDPKNERIVIGAERIESHTGKGKDDEQ